MLPLVLLIIGFKGDCLRGGFVVEPEVREEANTQHRGPLSPGGGEPVWMGEICTMRSRAMIWG